MDRIKLYYNFVIFYCMYQFQLSEKDHLSIHQQRKIMVYSRLNSGQPRVCSLFYTFLSNRYISNFNWQTRTNCFNMVRYLNFQLLV